MIKGRAGEGKKERDEGVGGRRREEKREGGKGVDEVWEERNGRGRKKEGME